MGTETLGWLLGLDNVTSIDQIDPSFAAAWAQGERPFWIFFGAVVLFSTALFFYASFQRRGSSTMRLALGISRGLLLTLLFITLANPVLQITLTNIQNPSLYVLIDGTDSMGIEDEYSDEERRELTASTGIDAKPAGNFPVTRAAYVEALLENDEQNLIRLLREKKFDVETFIFDGNSTSQLRKLSESADGAPAGGAPAEHRRVTTKGQVTALGNVLGDVGQQFGTGKLAGVVLISDFAHNSGVAPVGNRSGQQQSPASRLGVPIYTIGVGATEAMDLAVDMQTDPKMKRAEKTSVLVKLRQTGLQGRAVTVTVRARPLSGGRGDEGEIIGERIVTLNSSVESVEIPYTPTDAGRFEFITTTEAIDGEVVTENNRQSREVNIIDDYLRLMYVAHEPTWEWRFVKEVFHRDKLVGMEGFRTYLASSDPQVRESNVLFVPTLTPKRSDFFANDVIFLGDMPHTAISNRFAEMVKEFVGNFGGGLVVIGGPRFGPRELHGTPLADMLPVIIDPDASIRDDRGSGFELQLASHALRYPFMQLDSGDEANFNAWSNLGRMHWYQPVANLHEQAFALANHPTDTCKDGKTPQPLIAIRPYGAGEVVYLGFNETWRLRRKHGEKYFRQFWSQLIYRLGMSHALGSEKRFVVRTDRQQYRAEEKVTLTVEAYDENFEALDAGKLAGGSLAAELVSSNGGLPAGESRSVPVTMLRQGVFESSVKVFNPGEHAFRIKDPVTGKFSEVRFDVTDVSAERRVGVRNARLQQELAAETNGRSYELTNVSNLVNDLKPEPIEETFTRNHPLWSTPLWFIVIVGLMLSEWFIRKLINLS